MLENFNLGLTPLFNSVGEVSKPEVMLIENGKLVQFLTSTATAKEYNLTSNKASSGEMPRSPEVRAGTLKHDEILKKLGTGLYLSNLHYINWSDVQTARLTGMTRFACFWVEYFVSEHHECLIVNLSDVCIRTFGISRRV